jgi:hypothetical protein
MQSDDFVARLRRYDQVGPKTIITEAANEIERLRTQLEMWQDGNVMADSHHDELVRNADEFANTLTELRERVKTLTAERDEARRLICDLSWEDSKEVARQMGWDCFREER